MANKNIKVNLDVAAKIESASKTLNSLQSQLENLNFGKGLGKELEAILKNSQQEIEKIQKKLTDGFVDAADLASIEKAFSRIEGLSEALVKKSGSEGFLSGGLKKDIEAIGALEKAQKAYENSVAATERKRESLNRSVEDAKKAHADLLEQQKSQSTVTEKELSEQKALEELYKNQVAEAKKLRKEAQAALQVKINDSGGKYTQAQMNQKGSGLRKTDAYKKYIAAQANYEKAMAQYESAQTTTSSMVTKAMQVDALKEAEAAIKSAEAALENFNADLGKTKEQEAFEKLKQSLEGIDFSEVGIDISDIKNIDDLKKKLAELSTSAGQRAAAALNKFKASIKDVEDDVDDLGGSLGGARVEMDGLTESASRQDAFESKIKQFLGMAGAAETLRRSLRNAFDTIKELDATMTEMAVVTDLTVGDYWDQLPEYSKRASELGVSINSAYQAATLYYQQGLKSNEVTAISTETLKMAKIAGLSAADATDKMTAALRGFNMELNEASAQKIADVYSELAAITAADVDEISSAMTKTASIASSAGMEFETTAAFLSQIIETTRESAETAGTALKTVIARFQELKKSPSEIGEIDGEIVDANKIETALRSVGVALRDASGQFRDLDDVFLELSSKWDSLDTNTQRYIATIAAGSRQQSRFIAMMSDYARTQDLVAAANNSTGASQKQFEKTMESLEYKLEQLKNAWQEFSMGILNSDLVKVGVDILTKFLEIINKATSGLNGLGGSVVKIMSVIALFKLGQKVFEKFKNPMMAFFSEIVEKSYETGYNAGKAMAEGARAANQETAEKKREKQQPKEERNIFYDAIGVTDYKKAAQQSRQNKKDLAINQESITSTQKTLATLQAKRNKIASQGKSDQPTEELQVLDKQIKRTEQSLDDLNKKQLELKEQGYQTWQSIGNGIKHTGQALTGLGMGISMVGGLLSEAGFEEAGETFSKLGNWITIAGTALMGLGPIITAVSNIAKVQGIAVQAAWGWVSLIAGAIAALVLGTIAVINAVNNASPEKKLEKANKNAELAAENADKAAEAFNNLSDSIENLGDKYDALDDLVKGTKEWNEAMQGINQTVLELISKYPELAGLVDNQDGVLTLDVNSDEVQAIMKQYQDQMTLTQAASIGAKVKVAEAQSLVEFGNLDATKKVANKRAADAFNRDLLLGAGAGTATGAAVGGIGAVPGFLIGTASGLVGGGIDAGVTYAKTRSDTQLQKAVEEMAKKVSETGKMDKDSIKEYLGDIDSEEAELMAQAFAEDTEALVKFANSMAEIEKQQEAYYNAMATQAQSMLELNQYTQDQIDQMNSVVNGDKIKQYEENLENEYAKNNTKLNEDLEKFMAELEGVSSVKKIKNKRIVYIDKDGKTQRVDKQTYVNQMIAAKATEQAAEAMKEVPGAISDMIKGLPTELGDDVSKVFTGELGKALTAEDLTSLKNISYEADDNGNYIVENNQDLANIWKKMSNEGKEIWGSFDNFAKDFVKRIEAAQDSFEDALSIMEGFGVKGTEGEVFGNMSAEGATAWANNLVKVGYGAAEGEIGKLQDALNNITVNLSDENTALLMTELNAMDKMNTVSWDNLKNVLEDYNITVDPSLMNELIAAGKAAYNAITKIEFDKLSGNVNQSYQLLQKIIDGNRTYSEEDYKEIIESNERLKDSFIQIGDEFIYTGKSLDDLTDAVKANTIATLEDATEQLGTVTEMLKIAKAQTDKTADSMTYYEMMDYLSTVRGQLNLQGYNIEEFGIPGLSNDVKFYELDEEVLREMVKELTQKVAELPAYEGAYKTSLSEANIQKYTYNNAELNAERAADSHLENQKEYQEALKIQAIQSGAVSNSMIEKYNQAIKDNNEGLIRSIGKHIADNVNKIVKSNENRTAYKELVDRVAEALTENYQKEIDKLSDINDSINDANDKLLGKIQDQINKDRRADSIQKDQQKLSELYAKQAYLARDTSGMNASELLALNKEIQEAEEAMQETLVDEALTSLEDANQKAQEQREQQIDILQQQLDNYVETGTLIKKAEETVSDSINKLKDGTLLEDTEMYKLLFGNEAVSLSRLASEDWTKELYTMATQAINWFTGTTKNSGNNDTDDDKPGDDKPEETPDPSTSPDTSAERRNIAIAAAKKALGDDVVSGFKAAKKGENSDFVEAWKAYNEASVKPTSLLSFASLVTGLSKEDLNRGVEKFSIDDKIRITDTALPNEHGEVTVYTKQGTTGQEQFSANGNISSDVLNGQKILAGPTADNFGQSYYAIQPKGAGQVVWVPDFYLKHYKTGGLADFTGPAWLDGTKSRPELILDSQDTANFIILKDVLSEFLHNNKDNTANAQHNTGDNYYDVQINVDSIESDYDVEQLANKIRAMIYDDSTYRNVKAVGFAK